jgi:uridine kinase
MVFQMNKKPHLIGISGGSGSGKTFFLKSFLKHFKADEITLISQDDYYVPLGRELTTEENLLHNFDLPSCFDEALLARDIQQILSGETVYKEKYNFNRSSGEPTILEIKPAPIIMVEGLFVLYFESLRSLLDQKIFIHADIEVALQRRIKRDQGYGFGLDNVMYKWTNHILPSYEQYILPYKAESDQVVVNNTNVVDEIFSITADISSRLRQELFLPTS